MNLELPFFSRDIFISSWLDMFQCFTVDNSIKARLKVCYCCLHRRGRPQSGALAAGQVSLHRAPDRIYLPAAICQPASSPQECRKPCIFSSVLYRPGTPAEWTILGIYPGGCSSILEREIDNCEPSGCYEIPQFLPSPDQYRTN